MNFKENYQEEMNRIEKPAGITEKVLSAVDMEQETYASKKNRNLLKNSVVWKTAAAAVAIACVLGLWQHEKVIGFAESVVEGFTLSVNKTREIEFGMINPVDMDVEAFINDEKTEAIPGEKDVLYDQMFASYQEMNQLTQLEFPCADKVTYKEISVDIQPDYHTGHLSMALEYEGVPYRLNGMFTIEGFDQKNWGYGDKGKKEIYEYGDGKNACFIINNSKGKYEAAYFEENGILFQLFFLSPNKEHVKQLLDLFGNEN